MHLLDVLSNVQKRCVRNSLDNIPVAPVAPVAPVNKNKVFAIYSDKMIGRFFLIYSPVTPVTPVGPNLGMLTQQHFGLGGQQPQACL